MRADLRERLVWVWDLDRDPSELRAIATEAIDALKRAESEVSELQRQIGDARAIIRIATERAERAERERDAARETAVALVEHPKTAESLRNARLTQRLAETEARLAALRARMAAALKEEG